jgi:hypothetical protein
VPFVQIAKRHPAAMLMTSSPILPTRNPAAGFWAASQRNGYDAESVWAAASEALANVFGLSAIEVRDFLDGEAGHLLADDLGFIADDPANPETIMTLIMARLDYLGWQRFYRQAVARVRASSRAANHPQTEAPDP